jgi:hypothetical protein
MKILNNYSMGRSQLKVIGATIIKVYMIKLLVSNIPSMQTGKSAQDTAEEVGHG